MIMVIPQINREIIREYASSKSLQRGEAYYHDGYVRQVSQRGQSLIAEVSGSSRYRIVIDFNRQGLQSAFCNCPYDWGGYCKHIVASLLFCVQEPEKIQVRSSLEEILDRLNEVQTQNLIQQLAEQRPELLDDIERIADRLAPPTIVATPENRYWVIENALERAEAIMNAGKAKYYEEAVEWLKKVRAAYLASGREQAWSDYRANLVTVHGRKRKLMGLMESVV